MDCGSFDINGNVYQLVKLGLFGIAEPKFVHPECGNRGVQFGAMGGTEHLYKVKNIMFRDVGHQQYQYVKRRQPHSPKFRLTAFLDTRAPPHPFNQTKYYRYA